MNSDSHKGTSRSKSEKLKTIEDFARESSEKLELFENLESRSPHDPECGAFVHELRTWLLTCVVHGQYLSTGSPQRLASQGLLNEWKVRLRREGHRLEGVDHLAAFDPGAGVVLDAECPYPGLDAYRAARSRSFFGRTELSRRYVERLVTNRIFLIVGASGSGKSSLALAGIRPKLQELHPDWLYPAEFTPGATPLAALAAVVAAAAGRSEAAEPLVRVLREDPTSARTQLAQLCGGQSLMLLIDQFEELITLCRNTAEQAAFAAVLVALSDPPTTGDDWACYTLLTLRTDHLARFDSSNALKPLYVRLVDNHNSELLTTLSFEEIKRAIAEPAKAVGLRFLPPTIIDRLASQTAGLANGLPLLQFALRRLWDIRPLDKDTGLPLDLVTQPMVDALPDIQGALGTVAEGIFETFTERQKKICERALHELVLLDENFEEPLRRRRKRAELLGVLESRFPGAEQDVAEVEGQFRAAGLLRISGQGGDEQIEVAHEALLRHWERINRALSGDESKRRLHAVKQIAREAMEWQAHGRREDFLKQQGEPLQSALGYLADGWLAEAESKAYVEACVQRDAFLAEAVKAKKRTKWWVAGALVVALAVGIGVVLAKIQRDAGLATIASLGARLPPWEQLDVAYNVARSGGADYRFALGHALERMDGSWLLGKRDAPLSPVGDGTALRQFDGAQRSENLLIYLIGPDGNPRDKGIRIDLRGRKKSLAQAQVGPAIKTGTYSGRHLLVLVFREEGRPGGKPGFSIETSLLDPQAGTATALAAKDDSTALQGVEEVSAVRIHPDGSQAIWTAINYGELTSQIHELSLGKNGSPTIRAVPDPVATPIPTAADPSPKPNPTTAVAYGSDGNNGARLITGRLDGAVYCGNKKVNLDESTRVDSSPVRTIASQPTAALFAVGKFTGQVLAASCAKDSKAHALPLISSDPSSLRLTSMQLERNSKPAPAWIVSYFDQEQQLRCYAIDPTTLLRAWWVCNAAHLIGAVVSMTERGQQLVVEKLDVAAIRRYPNEELSRRGKQVHARQAGNSTLRWASRTGFDVGGLNQGDESPWVVEGTDVKAKFGRQIEGAALSPDGKRIVWIERLRTIDHKDVVPGINEDRQMTVSLIGSMAIGSDKADPRMVQDGLVLAVAIDDHGRIAHVQGSSDGSGKTILKLSTGQRVVELDGQDGRALCLAFSPNGKHLVLGTERGALRRFAGDLSASKPIELSRNKDEAKEGRANVSTTACAVADDGGVAAGYADGQVLYFSAEGEPAQLTARVVYGFPVPIKDVRIDPPGPRQRVTALGEWQIINCTHPGLPGQTLRAWDVTLPERQRGTPDAVACFPNAAIAALGAWGQKPIDDTSDQCPKADKGSVTAQVGMQVGLCLITAQEPRWHACPACGRLGDTPKAILDGAIESAKGKGAKPLTDTELEKRYGFKLGVVP